MKNTDQSWKFYSKSAELIEIIQKVGWNFYDITLFVNTGIPLQLHEKLLISTAKQFEVAHYYALFPTLGEDQTLTQSLKKESGYATMKLLIHNDQRLYSRQLTFFPNIAVFEILYFHEEVLFLTSSNKSNAVGNDTVGIYIDHIIEFFKQNFSIKTQQELKRFESISICQTTLADAILDSKGMFVEDVLEN